MAKIPPLVEGPRKGGRNPVRENFVRPDPPPAFRAKLTLAHRERNEIIERCAEVAEDILGPEPMPDGFDVPAAIRALKDKPCQDNSTQAQIKAAHQAAMKKCREEGRIGPTATAIIAALAAAAEVGACCTTEIITQHAINVEAATIERCAEVAENHPDKTITCNRIAADIRALKDKP